MLHPQPPAAPAQLPISVRPHDEQPAAAGPFVRWALPLLLLLALLHGVQYAALMPPWGLIDEAQHLDYILRLATTGEPPDSTAVLSPAIVDSLFATRHWLVFQWPTPPSPAPADLGPVGYSYEGYHPPLYYLLLAPVYASAPGSVLDRLFVVRGATVLLSLATTWLLFRLGRLLSGSACFAALAALVFVMLPERAAYASRVNNDVLAEVLGAGICLLAVYAMLHSLTRVRAAGLALLLALGVWTKLSVAFWLAPLALVVLWAWPRRDGRRWLLAWAGGGLAAALLAVRNLWLYGDVTGYAAFHRIYPLAAPPAQWETLAAAAGDLFRHFWFIWWQGSQVGGSPLLTTVYAVLAALALGSAALGARALWRSRRAWRSSARLAALLFLAGGALVYAAATLYTYFQGIVPVIQGRFLAPAMTAYVLLYAYGWVYGWRRHGAAILLGTAVLLFVVDLLLLWGNLLPYHYSGHDWSAAWSSASAAGGGAALASFRLNLSADKPPALVPLLPLLPAAYWLAAGATFIFFRRWSKAAPPPLA